VDGKWRRKAARRNVWIAKGAKGKRSSVLSANHASPDHLPQLARISGDHHQEMSGAGAHFDAAATSRRRQAICEPELKTVFF
jgi:hypothetical protein